jgi:ketosteroid isomerase-like protein
MPSVAEGTLTLVVSKYCMDVEDRLAALEDREALKELRAAYCYRIDAREWDAFASLFTEDAHLDFGPVGTFDGRDEVRRFAEAVVGGEHPFLAHMVHNPILELDGEIADGTWYFEVPCTFEDGNAGWIQGRYDDVYARIGGDWLFEEVVAEFNYFADYETGWADIVASDD